VSARGGAGGVTTRRQRGASPILTAPSVHLCYTVFVLPRQMHVIARSVTIDYYGSLSPRAIRNHLSGKAVRVNTSGIFCV
jgi:hypothetical protein